MTCLVDDVKLEYHEKLINLGNGDKVNINTSVQLFDYEIAVFEQLFCSLESETIPPTIFPTTNPSRAPTIKPTMNPTQIPSTSPACTFL